MKRVILGLFFATEALAGAAIYHRPADRVIAPFGQDSGQPPSAATMQLVDVRVDFNASQVCGYTDWTTVQVHMPPKILSKDYWKNVGEPVRKKAKDVSVQISGALPSMIACNISPQFCSVYSQAELLAASEASLTMKSCKIFDGISDQSRLHHEPMKRCVAEKMNKSEFPYAGQAIAACNSGKAPDEISKKKRSENISDLIENNHHFSMKDLIAKIFPDEVKGAAESRSLNASKRRYSRYFQARSFAEQLFPGISVSKTHKVMQGGAFPDSPEFRQKKEKHEIREAVIQIVKAMMEYKKKGLSDRQILEKSEPLWKDRQAWERHGQPSLIYRPAKDDEEPGFLIAPSQILMLLPLADMNHDGSFSVSEEMEHIIDQLASDASYIRQIDKLRDIYMGAEQRCMTDPELHSAVAQKNCELLMTRAKTSIDMLMIKQESEERSSELGRRIHERVRTRVMEKAARYSGISAGESSSGLYQSSQKGEIHVPGAS
ncbi:MAG: hypothetical protein H6618_05095 [Deltaproteobacteria bacterium]|nr:hypothetical protein [Deltaproteobacteria bacterium]